MTWRLSCASLRCRPSLSDLRHFRTADPSWAAAQAELLPDPTEDPYEFLKDVPERIFGGRARPLTRTERRKAARKAAADLARTASLG